MIKYVILETQEDDGISVTDIQDTEEYGAIYQAPMDYEE